MSNKSYPFVPLDWPHATASESQAHIRSFREAMSRRRSVRHFSPESIPEGVLEDAIQKKPLEAVLVRR